ncbi:MAG: HAMP domain-containing sensor histidine kinase [Fluviicola sp.]|nr:HAMP domain-containing sensor histidine kinase [Fluviicola sp.]
MNLYSNKQKWKLVLLGIALIMVAVSLWVSNSVVQRVSDRERLRVKQWADAIKKKAELVEFTDRAFNQLREYERKKIQLYLDATREVSKPIPGDAMPDYDFPLSIIDDNKDIPVILVDDQNVVSGHINLDFDTADIRKVYPNVKSPQLVKLFEDSLLKLTKAWNVNHQAFTIEVVEGLSMTYYYNDSWRTVQLERERDSLIGAFNKELITDSRLVPVLLMQKESDSLIASNMSHKLIDSAHLKATIQQLGFINEPLLIRFDEGKTNLLYYDDSEELKQLQYYPYIQFLIIGLFILIGYLLFNTFRKAEQNQVWAGMAKETAHQLGTPLSSLMAWIQLLETQDVDQSIIAEMQKDIERLDTVSQRFSKIGSDAQLKPSDVQETIQRVMNYLRPRISNKVSMDVILQPSEVVVNHNPPLLEWVMENIIKNAVDSMESTGAITVDVHTTPEWAHIDITDTGKGLHPKQFKTIFQPGYTTKKRGWGLGLSLVRRIVREYHKGKVFVLRSEPGKGTTFRISLPL